MTCLGSIKTGVLSSANRDCGWKIPSGAIYIGRTNARFGGGKWGNPFVVGKHGDRKQVVARYRVWICDQPDLMNSLHELRGHDLVCWCSPLECHGTVLLELAN